MIYAVVNTKGGVGKTTTAVHLATMLAREGNTLLIDGDPQASAASWAAWRRDNPEYSPSPTTTCLTGKAILSEGKQLAIGFKNVVVDAGGRDSIGLRSALLLAQKAIIPIGAHYIERGFVANGFYNLAGMPSMALSSLDIEKLSSRSGECEREVVDQILLGHSTLVGRPNIGFASGETQDSLAQSIESFINSGFLITRYFKNKELNKWIVIAEKNSVIPSEIREAA